MTCHLFPILALILSGTSSGDASIRIRLSGRTLKLFSNTSGSRNIGGSTRRVVLLLCVTTVALTVSRYRICDHRIAFHSFAASARTCTRMTPFVILPAWKLQKNGTKTAHPVRPFGSSLTMAHHRLSPNSLSSPPKAILSQCVNTLLSRRPSANVSVHHLTFLPVR